MQKQLVSDQAFLDGQKESILPSYLREQVIKLKEHNRELVKQQWVTSDLFGLVA